MLCVCWDHKGIIYWDTLTRLDHYSDVYCRQLENLNTDKKDLKQAIANMKMVMFQQDNADRMCFWLSKQSYMNIAEGLLFLSLYSPGISPYDYHLFLSQYKFIARKSI